MSIRWRELLAVGFLMCVHRGRAWALDTNRELTQALHRIWQVQQGLPDPTIFSVKQFSDGYLWLGTQSGVDRFDGVRFSRIDRRGTSTVGLPWVKDLTQGADGVLWLATATGGVIELRKGEVVQHSVKEALGGEGAEQVCFVGTGMLWVRGGGRLARLRGGRFERVGMPEGFGDVTAIVPYGRKGLWVGGEGGRVAHLDGDSSEVKKVAAIPAGARIAAMVVAEDGTLWVGTSEGLVHVGRAGEELFTTAEGLPDDGVLCLGAGSEGTVWVGTRSGFSRVRGKEVDSYRPEDGLSQSTVYSICEDREGSLWVGTKHGLNQFLDGRTIPFTVSEGLASNDAGPVVEDGGAGETGTTWVGTLGSGLSRFDGKKFVGLPAAEAERIGSGIIYALAGEGRGDGLWVGTDKGVARLAGDGGVTHFGKAEGLPSEIVKVLFRDGAGSLWAGTEAGLAVVRAQKFEAICQAALGTSAVVAIGQDARGALLVSTAAGGLYAVNGESARDLSGGDERLRDVDAFYRDADGCLWMGTSGKGLRLMDAAGKVTAFGVADGLFDDEIFGIVADGDGRLWMACGKGIFSVSREELVRFSNGEIGHVTSTPFSPTDAQRTIECRSGVQPAAWRMGDGRLWFSTIHGVIVIDPRHMQRAIGPAPAVIEEVVVNGQSEEPGEIGTLPPGVKNLQFNYTGLSFLVPVRMGFRYQLEGFDKEWVEAGPRREAFYTNLPPGSYRFRVAAKNVEGAWTEAAGGVAFTLAPHVYQRWWFWPACVAVAIAGVWSVYRLRVRAIKGRMVAILGERSRIARELHDTLLQGFSGVTMEMQALAGRLPASGERETLQGIIGDAAECMKEARRSVAGLRQGERVTLAMAVEQAAKQLTETKEVRLKLDLAERTPALPVDVEYNLVKIAQEAIANAVKHSGARVIEVGLKAEGQGVRLTVRDDGRGFDGGANGVGGHYGLVGMRERAGLIGGDLRVKTGVGEGTVVSVGAGSRQ